MMLWGSQLTKEIRIKRQTRRSLSGLKQRVTSQRALLLELLRQGAQHLDAGDLYRLARRRQPRLSLSTVYRSLQLFKQLGLVEEHHFAEEHHHYEIKPEASHQHLTCLGCGKIIEFKSSMTDKLKEVVAKEHDFTITGLEIQLTGLCKDCQQQKKR